MEIGKYIDHTNLKMDATSKDIAKLCREAIEYGFETVCVNPCYVPLAKDMLKDTNIGVCTVVGFPLGATTPKVKSYEAIEACENGADEIDMVINVGALKDKDYDFIKKEIEEVRDCIDGKVLKVIIETSLLEDEEIINHKGTILCWSIFFIFFSLISGILGLIYYFGLNNIQKNKLNYLDELERLKKLYDEKALSILFL